jgi:uncharacterized protein
MPNILYLHGFASSPGSTKAGLFQQAFAEYSDVTYAVPDLNAPSFEKLTLTAILARVDETINALADDETYLIGSSFGGLAAVHYTQQNPNNVQKIVLLAPALDFMANRTDGMGASGLADWQAAGQMPFFHYAYNEQRPVHYGLVEDIQQYDSDTTDFTVPTLICHGRNDASVNYEQSVRWVQGRDFVTLRVVESDHSLLDQTEQITAAMIDFFRLERG